MKSNKIHRTFIASCFLAIFLTGCATLLKGYEDSVRINGASDSLRVFTKEGIEIPVIKTQIDRRHENYILKEIKLRSNESHDLILRNRQSEKTISIYPKLGFGWVLLDLACGGLPSFYDAYTGNWNKFSTIDAEFEQK